MSFAVVLRLRLLSVALAAVLFGVRSAVASKPCDASYCIDQSGILKLSHQDSNIYCTQGPRKVKQIFDCMNACGLSAINDGSVVEIFNNVTSNCAEKDPNCNNIVRRYLTFTDCYFSYGGGLLTIGNKIIQAFNSGRDQNKIIQAFNSGRDQNSQRSACQNLGWSRGCQLIVAGNCSFLQNLQSSDIASKYINTALFYLCGAESGSFAYSDTNNCNIYDSANVDNICNVMCNLTSTTTASEVCQLLQHQADCIQDHTAGCSADRRKYIVPRLTAYWAANELLGCSIKISGITVRAQASHCSVNSLLTSCFNMPSISPNDVGVFNSVKQLLTMQFPTFQISKDTTQQCLEAMASCSLPHAQAFNWPTMDSPVKAYSPTAYSPQIGPFALNVWGQQTIQLISSTDSTLFNC